VLGAVAVDPTGRATLVVPFGVGSHTLTASFAGTPPFTASTSAAVTETVTSTVTVLPVGLPAAGWELLGAGVPVVDARLLIAA